MSSKIFFQNEGKIKIFSDLRECSIPVLHLEMLKESMQDERKYYQVEIQVYTNRYQVYGPPEMVDTLT
jgi:hypothetical protein